MQLLVSLPNNYPKLRSLCPMPFGGRIRLLYALFYRGPIFMNLLFLPAFVNKYSAQCYEVFSEGPGWGEQEGESSSKNLSLNLPKT